MSVSVDSAHILERAEKVCRDERSTGVLVSHTRRTVRRCTCYLSISVPLHFFWLQLFNESACVTNK